MKILFVFRKLPEDTEMGATISAVEETMRTSATIAANVSNYKPRSSTQLSKHESQTTIQTNVSASGQTVATIASTNSDLYDIEHTPVQNQYPIIYFSKNDDFVEMRSSASPSSSSSSSTTYESIDNISELDLIDFDDVNDKLSNNNSDEINYYMKRKRADSCENFVLIVDNLDANHNTNTQPISTKPNKTDIILNVLNIKLIGQNFYEKNYL